MSKTVFTIGDDKKSLHVERVFQAALTKVWKAYSDPELSIQWWSPKGWETEVKHMNFEEGGYWHYGMTCVHPEQKDLYGTTSWGKATFLTIQPEDLLEYKDEFSDEAGKVQSGFPVSYSKLTLSETNGATRVNLTVTYDTPEALTQVLEMGMEEGFKESWDRLDQLLSK
jgi:uncharacterized protein YndB with AHSA1/START domain